MPTTAPTSLLRQGLRPPTLFYPDRGYVLQPRVAPKAPPWVTNPHPLPANPIGVAASLSHRGDLDGTELYHYDGQKLIETRQVIGLSEYVMRQYVWGTQYLDELVREDVNGDYLDDDDYLESGTDAAYYYHQDANYNVTAVTDAAGDVVRRPNAQPPLAHRAQ